MKIKNLQLSNQQSAPVKSFLIVLLSTSFLFLLIGAVPDPATRQAVELTVCNSGCTHTTIQAAINAITPGTSGNTIKVAQGTYFEAPDILNIGVVLIGGYAPPNFATPVEDPSLTVIDAIGQGDSAIWIGSGVPGLSVTIENFTITGGTGRFDGNRANGGGIRVEKVTATIRNNIIQGNSADQGGGININDDNSPLIHKIVNNRITGNTATNNRGIGFGGGIDVNTSAAIIVDNTLSNNVARCGGAIVLYASNAVVERNIISNNQASLATAGEGCIGGDGGALFIELVNTSPSIKNNVIANNTAIRGDGINIAIGPGRPQIINNTIVNNKDGKDFDDGIFYVGETITPIIRNNIIALNGSGIHRGNNVATPFATMSNNLLWSNDVDYRNLSAGSDDLSADPLFVNQAGNDYHLQAGSLAIDAGTNADAPSNDLEETPRPLDGNGSNSAEWDIGVYEFASWLTKRANPTAVDPGDTVTFTITYQNNSASTLTGAVITDTLSTDLINPTFTSGGANIALRGGTTYVWDVDNLASGSGGVITITAEVDPNVITPTAIANTAEFQAGQAGIFDSQALIIVGGVEVYLPLVIK